MASKKLNEREARTLAWNKALDEGRVVAFDHLEFDAFGKPRPEVRMVAYETKAQADMNAKREGARIHVRVVPTP